MEEKIKVLVVDDDIDFITVTKMILENQNYEVVTASNKVEGMKVARREKPQLAVLDVMMTTEQEGFEMARELRQDPEFVTLPIILLTSVDSATGINFKDAAGDSEWMPVDAFLEKPVDSEQLIAEINKLLPK
ncbi:MAG: response regulator [Bacteroidetes bacterium]|nr:MAG: response regulator [Bacteroidota bacterium]